MSGTRWSEENAAEWLHGTLQGDIRDHQVYYVKCLGTGPEKSRWLDGRTSDGTVGLAPITTWPYTGTRWRAHRLQDGAWAFRCLGELSGNRWLDGQTAYGTVGLAPNPRYPFTGARWQVLPVAGGNALKCLGVIDGAGRRFLDGVTGTATAALAPHIDAPYTGTHWELRPERWWVGCNFIPSTAVNQLEMWQRDTFDLATIKRELSWARDLGFNVARVFLHDLVWQADAAGLIARMRAYLDAAAAQGISTLFVFFDDCWNSDPKPGPQPSAIADAHNSRWVQSPGDDVVKNPDHPAAWGPLKEYVQGVIGAFGDDSRVMGWDLYNEPGGGLGPPCVRAAQSMPLVQEVFAWAREVDPSQPLTSGVWADNTGCDDLHGFQLDSSDVISFHRYADPDLGPSVPPHPTVATDIAELQQKRRPLICTEYMARPLNSRFENHLARFQDAGVGCFNWGLVGGKTQTFLPWGWEPRCEWFHDILRPWGTPYSATEVAIIRCLTGSQPAGAGVEHNAIYQFRCLGHVRPENMWWLDGRTATADVGLAPNTDPPYTGTKWRAVKQMDGVFAFECLGSIETQNRWLDGRTTPLDATVDLGPDVNDKYTGTQWQPCQVENNIYIFRCLGEVEGPRLLDGRTGDGTVGLTPHTGTAITGIQWELTKIADG